MDSDPTTALPLFAKLFEERPDLRPKKFGVRLQTDYYLCWWEEYVAWAWSCLIDSAPPRGIDDADALAHCIAHTARLVAEAGFVIWQIQLDRDIKQWFWGRTYDTNGDGDTMAASHAEALIAAARELPEVKK